MHWKRPGASLTVVYEKKKKERKEKMGRGWPNLSHNPSVRTGEAGYEPHLCTREK
jgi:hypothetical protein